MVRDNETTEQRVVSSLEGARMTTGQPGMQDVPALIVVLGKMDSKWLVRSEFTPGKAHIVGQRTLDALVELGIPVHDRKDTYIL